jgi:hypothetical protein
VTVDPAQIAAGETAQITVELQGSISGTDTEGITVKPDGALFDVSCAVEDETYQLSPRTYVDFYNVLHTQDDLPSGAVITINATAIYTNPSGVTTKYTDTATVTIS